MPHWVREEGHLQTIGSQRETAWGTPDTFAALDNAAAMYGSNLRQAVAEGKVIALSLPVGGGKYHVPLWNNVTKGGRTLEELYALSSTYASKDHQAHAR